jgi:hypothetical protein
MSVSGVAAALSSRFHSLLSLPKVAAQEVGFVALSLP